MTDTDPTDHTPPPALAHRRLAIGVELVLQFVSGAGIVALLVMMANLDQLLAAGESVQLVRVRLLKGIVGFAMPLVILVLLSGLRIRLTTMLGRQNAAAEMIKTARYIWITAIAFVLLILIIDVNIVLESLRDIEFR